MRCEDATGKDRARRPRHLLGELHEIAYREPHRLDLLAHFVPQIGHRVTFLLHALPPERRLSHGASFRVQMRTHCIGVVRAVGLDCARQLGSPWARRCRSVCVLVVPLVAAAFVAAFVGAWRLAGRQRASDETAETCDGGEAAGDRRSSAA